MSLLLPYVEFAKSAEILFMGDNHELSVVISTFNNISVRLYIMAVSVIDR